jgi:predicted ATPase
MSVTFSPSKGATPTLTTNTTNRRISEDASSLFSDLTAPSGSFRSSGSRRRSQRFFDEPRVLNSSVQARRLGSDPSNIAQLQFHKLGLIGRKEEIKLIRGSLKSLMEKNHNRSVLKIHGPSGVGKTFLAEQVLQQDSPTNSSLLVGSGKIDLNGRGGNGGDPLTALKSAFQVIALNVQDRSPSLYQTILQDIDADEVLQAWLPLSQSISHAEKTVSMQQLEYATSSFLAKVAHLPIIFLIDDVQWVDETTMILLKSWLLNDAVGPIMIVLCFRDTPTCLHTAFLDPIQDYLHENAEKAKTFQVQEIILQPLDLNSTHRFVYEVLNSSESETQGLAQLVHRKTNGNPFYLVSFLKSLQEKSHLTFHLGLLQWKWDMDILRQQTMVTDNVVDMLQEKLLRSNEARTVLPVAAVLGATFSTSMLHPVFQAFQDNELAVKQLGLTIIPNDLDEISAWLSVCELDGYIDQLHISSQDVNDRREDTAYRFVHDQVQEAALRLMGSSRLSILRYSVGRALVKDLLNSSGNVTKGTPPHMVFTAANLINAWSTASTASIEFYASNHAYDSQHCPTDVDYHDLVNINFAAGNLAMSQASFKKASEYFNNAIDNLGKNCWKEPQQLAARLYCKAAWANYCLGEVEQMREDCDLILQRSELSLLDKVPAYHILMQSYLSLERNNKALQMNLDLLEQLGVRFPKRTLPITLGTMLGLLKCKGLTRGLEDKDIEALPIVDDRKELVIDQTLNHLVTSTYSAKPELIPLVILELANRTIKIGITQHSSVTFAFLGLLMAAGLEDFEATKSCYHRALALKKRVPSKEVESRLMFTLHEYVFPWFMPQQNCLQPLMTAYNQGLVTGDLENAAYAIMFHCENALFVARPLHLIDEDCGMYSVQLKNYSQMKQRRFVLNVWQVTRNLRGMGQHTSELKGDIVDIDHETKCLLEHNDITLLLALQRMALFLAICMSDYKRCADIALEWTERMVKNLPGQGANIQTRYYSALSGLIMAQNVPKQFDRQKYKRLGMKNAKVIHSWMTKGNPNCVHMDAFLDAEKAQLKKNCGMAAKHYEYAIILAGRRGLLHEQAMASERYAYLLFDMGNQQDGMERLKDAVKWFQEWGAFGKANLLETVLNDYL